jgi:hypothetical protein
MPSVPLSEYAQVFEHGTVLSGRKELVPSKIAIDTIACLEYLVAGGENDALLELQNAKGGTKISQQTIELMGSASTILSANGKMLPATHEVIFDTLRNFIEKPGYYVDPKTYMEKFQEKLPENIEIHWNNRLQPHLAFSQS